MTRFWGRAAIVLLALFASSSSARDSAEERGAQKDDVVRDTQFTGRKLDPAELADSEPRQIIGKDELANVFSGKGLQCKDGALRAGYSREKGFIFSDGAIATDDVIAEIKRRHGEGRLSCFFVESTDYDRAVFDRLAEAVGTGSVMWNDQPAGDDVAEDERTQEKNP